jgi:hypothetical protein
MKKFKCSECGEVVFENMLNEETWTAEDFAEYAYLWKDAGYALTDNQKMFCIDVDDAGIGDIDFTYSGRCMYGKCCPSIDVDSDGDFKTDARYRTDSMGRGIVMYAQN